MARIAENPKEIGTVTLIKGCRVHGCTNTLAILGAGLSRWAAENTMMADLLDSPVAKLSAEDQARRAAITTNRGRAAPKFVAAFGADVDAAREGRLDLEKTRISDR